MGTLDEAVVATVAYFDVFACAPTPREIHRFLLGRRASRREVEDALARNPELAARLGREGHFVFLAGKAHLAARRARALERSAALWPRARRIARIIDTSRIATSGMLSGALALDNADDDTKLEFVFTFPTERALASLAAMRLLSRLLGFEVRPLSASAALLEGALAAEPQDLFTAFEIAKAVPMFGFDVHRAFVHANRWVERYLPNALPDLEAPAPAPLERRSWTRTLAKAPPLQLLEAVERRRLESEERSEERSEARNDGPGGEPGGGVLRGGAVAERSAHRSFQTLSELRYRMRQLGLDESALFEELTETPGALGAGPTPPA